MPYMVTAFSGIRGYTEGEVLREEDERLARLYPHSIIEISDEQAERLAGIEAGSPQELQRARAEMAREIVAAQGPREARPAEGPVTAPLPGARPAGGHSAPPPQTAKQSDAADDAARAGEGPD